MKLVLVDMDGVLAHFEKEFLKRWRRRYPQRPSVPLQERTTFYLRDEPVYAPYSDEVRYITSEAGFFASLPLIKGGPRALHLLKQRGYDIRICTSPLSHNPTCLQEKYDWVLQNLNQELAKSMIIAKDKTLIRGDFLIDDRPLVTGSMEPVWKQIVFGAAYNLHVQDLPWVSSWEGVLELFP